MSFVVTPLLAGLFDDTFLTKTVVGEGFRAARILDGGNSSTISSNFMYVAYDYAWRSRILLPFTTEAYALLPVLPASEVDVGNETWIADTTLFELDLECNKSSTITIVPNDSQQITKVSVNSDARPGWFQICEVWSQNSDTEAPELLPGGGCEIQSSFTRAWSSVNSRPWWEDGYFIYTWASGLDLRSEATPNITVVPRNITGIFCEPHYYSQSVLASVKMPSGEVIDVDRIGDRLPLSGFEGFSTVMAGGSNNVIPEKMRNNDRILTGLGYPPGQIPNTDAQIQRKLGNRQDSMVKATPAPILGLSNSTIYMSVYGVQGFFLYEQTPETLVNLLDADTLAATYQKAWRMLFSIAMRSEMINHTIADRISVKREIQTRGFKVNMAWARGAQACLLLVVVLVMLLTFLIPRRPCLLDGEPNSLAAALRLLDTSPNLCAILDNAEFIQPKKLLRADHLAETMYCLELVPRQGAIIRTVTMTGAVQTQSIASEKAAIDPMPNSLQPWAKRPKVLKRRSGVIFVMVLLIIAATMIVAFLYADLNNGK